MSFSSTRVRYVLHLEEDEKESFFWRGDISLSLSQSFCFFQTCYIPEENSVSVCDCQTFATIFFLFLESKWFKWLYFDELKQKETVSLSVREHLSERDSVLSSTFSIL